MPVEIQERVVAWFIGKEKASAWRYIMTRAFDFEGQSVSYETGQPMGAYSSWPVMALTHHILV